MATNVTEYVDNGELGAYIHPVGRWRAEIVNQPTYFYMSVAYTEGLDQAFTRASYSGVKLDVEYGSQGRQARTFNTGDFATDYVEALAFAEDAMDGREVPVMGSSSVDSYQFDAGVTEADVEAALNRKRASLAGQQKIDQAVAVTDTVARLNAALDGGLPREKLVYALAKVIATDDYNTAYPGAPLGRDEALRALDVLKHLLAGVA